MSQKQWQTNGVISNYPMENKMTNVYYSVELESNSYMDDIINGTLEECREWCKEHKYTNADGRIAQITDDGDPMVTAFYDIED